MFAVWAHEMFLDFHLCKMIKILILGVVAATLLWWWFRPVVLNLNRNGYYMTDVEGLDPQRLSFSFDFKASRPGCILCFSGNNGPEIITSIVEITADGELIVKKLWRGGSYSFTNVIKSKSKLNLIDDSWHSVAFTEINEPALSTSLWRITVDNEINSIRFSSRNLPLSISNARLGMNLRSDTLFSGEIRNIVFGGVEKTRFEFKSQNHPA